MPHDRRQDKEDQITARILAVFASCIAAFTVGILFFVEIPQRNEILLGTVIGFVFGNMVGPVFRKVFGGMDAETRRAQDVQGDTLSAAVSGLAASSPPPPPPPSRFERREEEIDEQLFRR